MSSETVPEPVLTPGVEPTSGESHSPPASLPNDGIWDMKGKNVSNRDWNDAEANKLPEKVEEMDKKDELPKDTKRKRIVVVGLGMVGIAFM
jgi:nitrite reductase (NAD(P)H)